MPFGLEWKCLETKKTRPVEPMPAKQIKSRMSLAKLLIAPLEWVRARAPKATNATEMGGMAVSGRVVQRSPRGSQQGNGHGARTGRL